MTIPYTLADTLFDADVDPNNIVTGRSFYYADASPIVGTGSAHALVAYDDEAVAGQIEMILGTPIGSEEFEPTLGCNITKSLFDNLNQNNLSGIELEALDALRRWLSSRLDIYSVSTSKDPATGDVYILIPFRIKVSGVKKTYLGNLTKLSNVA